MHEAGIVANLRPGDGRGIERKGEDRKRLAIIFGGKREVRTGKPSGRCLQQRTSRRPAGKEGQQ